MKLDRRAPKNCDRRSQSTMTESLNNVKNPEQSSGECYPMKLSAIEETISRREKSASLRESAILVREDAAHGREKQALERESSVSMRELEISNIQKLKTAQEEFNIQLRQANEHLVVASIQAQTIAEELEKSKSEMARLAHHDFLTDLPNRLQLYDRIGQAIASARRRRMQLAVLFLDLDGFKQVNDSMGHAMGDKLLQAVAQRLKCAVRDSDTVSRQGGDEFVLLLADVTEEENLALKVESVREIIAAPYDVTGTGIQIGASIGVSIFPDDGEDTETLIRHADAAMYCAKQNGRNKCQFFRQEMDIPEIE